MFNIQGPRDEIFVSIGVYIATRVRSIRGIKNDIRKT